MRAFVILGFSYFRLNKAAGLLACLALSLGLSDSSLAGTAVPEFQGNHYRGRGDVEYLQLLETARRMFEPDPEYQNLSMLYMPVWNGLVEGPTWDAWWIQNSYGTTYNILPLLQEPFVTFLQHSQDLWFDQMGDGKRVGAPAPLNWTAPDGCLCDAARPGWIVYKQGDGRTAIHDWGMEFTAAGVVLQTELLLISRDARAIAHYLPLLERSANFIETRRDPKNNLFLAGPAGNLLAPSYAGWKRPDGTYDKAYLAGLSITYIAALDRLIELEKLAGYKDKVVLYSERRDLARRGLPKLTTDDGYFIRSLDPDGTRHGVYGAEKHGYFEASPNHDAIAFRVVDESQARRIYQKLVSLPGLRPHQFVLPNFPSYDDMYEKAEGLWGFGTWVNGGHWSTCEARMLLAYYRLGHYEEARRSMQHLLEFARRFRMDNPLTKCGSDVYQPKEPINLCYDSFGPAAAFMRGLFEYLYRAEALTLVPHIPPGISELHQLDPIRFGSKRLWLSTYGTGAISSVKVNGRNWKQHDSQTVVLPFDKTPDEARVEIALGGAKIKGDTQPKGTAATEIQNASKSEGDKSEQALREFSRRLAAEGLGQTYVAAHARLAVRCAETARARVADVQAGRLKALPDDSEKAADKCYSDTATKLSQGLETVMKTYEGSPNPQELRFHRLWVQATSAVEGSKPGK